MSLEHAMSPIPIRADYIWGRRRTLSRSGLKVVVSPVAEHRMSIPLARTDYRPSTTTMLMLEDLERMSSSAVYSGDSSQVWIC